MDARAALNAYSDRPHGFDSADIRLVQDTVRTASGTLRLAVLLARHRETEADLTAAMASRTTIDLAVGIVMGQNRCTQDEAFQILVTASNHRNLRLREPAAELVATVGHGPAATRFDR